MHEQVRALAPDEAHHHHDVDSALWPRVVGVRQKLLRVVPVVVGVGRWRQGWRGEEGRSPACLTRRQPYGPGLQPCVSRPQPYVARPSMARPCACAYLRGVDGVGYDVDQRGVEVAAQRDVLLGGVRHGDHLQRRGSLRGGRAIRVWARAGARIRVRGQG